MKGPSVVPPGRRRWAGAWTLCLCLLVACSANPLSRKYEYEEDVYVDLDGSAVVYVNASVPALVALRGAPLPLDPRARLDRRALRAWFESPAARVVSLSASRRDGRRYVHVRFDVDDIRGLSAAPVFAWSTYSFETGEDETRYRQQVGAAAGQPVGSVGWTGRELVAFRLHLPGRVLAHNAPSGEILRGNIAAWEQPLTERLGGAPVDIQVRMASASILASTLRLVAIVAVLVILAFAAVIGLLGRRGAGQA